MTTPRQARAALIEQMRAEHFDLVVIGGGITGAAIARDAALRGFKVALVERQDFAGGTSGKSARLVHGGLRYIETREFGVVIRACAERGKLDTIAPHLVTPLPFTLSVYGDPSRFRRVRLGLRIYDALGLYRNLRGHQVLSASELAQLEPVVSQHDWVGAVRYFERRADDARLTLSTILAAGRQGAQTLNYAEVQGLLKSRGRVVGVAVCDRLAGTEFELRGSVVVAAAGVWNDGVRSLDEPGLAPSVRPNKGIHVIVAHSRLPLRAAVDFPAAGGKRTMYAVPWRHTCLIGTTDTDYTGDLDSVHALPDEVDWILASANQGFAGANLSRADVLSTYAGLRPLVSSHTTAAYRAPREHHITLSSSGLISIAGGKLTTHRAMAQDTVDVAAKRLGWRAPCRTARAPLDEEAATPQGLAALEAGVRSAAWVADDEAAHRLVSTYGSDAWQVLRLCGEQPDLQRPIREGLPYLYAEVVHAVQHEMASGLTDVMIRRLRIIHEDEQQGLGLAAEIAACMAPHLGWSEADVQHQVAAYRREVALTRQFERLA